MVEATFFRPSQDLFPNMFKQRCQQRPSVSSSPQPHSFRKSYLSLRSAKGRSSTLTEPSRAPRTVKSLERFPSAVQSTVSASESPRPSRSRPPTGSGGFQLRSDHYQSLPAPPPITIFLLEKPSYYAEM